jgi:hypothetical protein
MGRRVLGILAVAGSIVLLGATTSWASAPAAHGKVGCKVTGSGTFSPMLTRTGSPGGVKYNFKATSHNCSASARTLAGGPVTITGVTIQGSGFWNPTVGPSGSKCASLPTDKVGSLSMSFTWIATPAILPTTLTITGGKPWVPSGTIFDYKFPHLGGAIGGSAGSFAPPTFLAYTWFTNIANPCGATWGPYPTFSITGGFFNLPG